MGTRIVYQVLDSDRNLIATLYSNSSHDRQPAEAVFDRIVNDPEYSTGPTALVAQLIALRYMTAGGNHQAGDRLFWLVPADEAEHGDREAVVTVTHTGVIEELAERAGAITGKWTKERKAVA
jgi:hypothetical protein